MPAASPCNADMGRRDNEYRIRTKRIGNGIGKKVGQEGGAHVVWGGNEGRWWAGGRGAVPAAVGGGGGRVGGGGCRAQGGRLPRQPGAHIIPSPASPSLPPQVCPTLPKFPNPCCLPSLQRTTRFDPLSSPPPSSPPPPPSLPFPFISGPHFPVMLSGTRLFGSASQPLVSSCTPLLSIALGASDDRPSPLAIIDFLIRIPLNVLAPCHTPATWMCPATASRFEAVWDMSHLPGWPL